MSRITSNIENSRLDGEVPVYCHHEDAYVLLSLEH